MLFSALNVLYKLNDVYYVIANTILASLTTSFLFYIIVVLWPERKKFINEVEFVRLSYIEMKKEVLFCLSCCFQPRVTVNECYDIAHSIEAAKTFFDKKHIEYDDNFYGIINNIADNEKIVLELFSIIDRFKDKLLVLSGHSFIRGSKESSSLYHWFDAYDQAKSNLQIYKSPDYDTGLKMFSRFLFGMFTAFDVVDGQCDKDFMMVKLDLCLNKVRICKIAPELCKVPNSSSDGRL